MDREQAAPCITDPPLLVLVKGRTLAPQRDTAVPGRTRFLHSWLLFFVSLAAILLAIFGALALLGYNHLKDLTVPRDDTTWVLSQIGYEHQRLMFAAETGAAQQDLRLRGDIYLSRVDLLRDAPTFAELRGRAPPEILSDLYASAENTNTLIDAAGRTADRGALLARLRADSAAVRGWTTELARLDYGIAVKNLADQTSDVLRYSIGLGLVTIIAAIAGILAIVTSRRNVTLEAERAQAVAASRMKSQFLTNMSHEIRTPLNGIIGTLQVIDDHSLSSGNRESIEIVRKSSGLLLEVVNNILDASKLEAGQSNATIHPFETRRLVADVLAHNAGLVAEKNLDLLVEFDESLPVEMHSDRLKIEQILNNLVSNAQKFTAIGSVTLTVRRSGTGGPAADGNAGITFSVTDTGIGISEADLSKLFEPFSQIDESIGRRYKGTGLGLNIARGLAEELGGTIGVRSKPGTGTTFTLLLPQPHADIATAAAVQGSGKDPEIVLLGTHSTIFRTSLALSDAGVSSRNIRSTGDAEHFLHAIPASVRAIVVDRRFEGEAIDWLAKVVGDATPSSLPPIILVRGARPLPLARSNLPIFEVEGRFSQSSLLETLQRAVPSMSLRRADAWDGRQLAEGGLPDLINGVRVLVVDDNSINRRVLAKLLSNIGVSQVEQASGAREALALLERMPFDLVFMDLQMPDVDGYRAARMIREAGHGHIRIYAYSAHAHEADIRRSSTEGLDGHLAKPVQAKDLIAIIKAATLPS